ncbi:MAG: transglycosylase SLT domain-containing protein [Bacteroidales bacterium]|nr:transglycosylase SLT domain-containing protein [Bacteroidales bacterium]
MKAKTITTLILLLCFAFWAGAQDNGGIFNPRNKRPRYKELEEQFQRLRLQNDSLRKANDTLRIKILENEASKAEKEKNEKKQAVSRLSHDPSQVKESAINAGASLEEIPDDRRFTSDVSDEEFMERLEEMHSFIALPFNSTVKNYMILYSERSKQRTEKIMGDAKYYFPIFEEVFIKYGMPEELKYMSVIESALKPRATSRAGAKGLWQFMYTTGKLYGLEINSYVDERMDTYKAVDAAARYLMDAYYTFGDWALAISSYNCGSGNVKRAIQAAGGKEDFWSIYPYLPHETRGYVPAFVGAMYAMKYHEEYGMVPGENPMPHPVDTIQIHRKLHFRQINEVVGVPMSELELLNTQYIHHVIPGGSTYILRLSAQWAEKFRNTDSEELYNYKSEEIFSSSVIKGPNTENRPVAARKKSGTAAKSRSYVVKSGDSLEKIARKNGVSVQALQKANGIKGSHIKPGQKLKIPSGTTTKKKK